ncbi:MAG TPA: type II toxin-antitoxin system Phd/YefM family antitoxin [Candidatus Faecivivens stercoripullorum]|uniref:Type II toxin-antitoxin system Phd/YefM family antitoxin n=1 Tax=Candidatus Faecivivens stercoripullorum TaxID=2840805 RepID=A0A9D1H5E0_9FIRM|nr:type II toxin-antitoxin system Phd/YefM family antitoxin [Candidatus Faecivivens stercoripullorum]
MFCPNAETLAAIQAAEKNTDVYGRFDSVSALMDALNASTIPDKSPEQMQTCSDEDLLELSSRLIDKNRKAYEVLAK